MTEASPIALLRQLKDGTRSPKAISSADRRACVEHLLGESYGTAEIAEILQVNRRTVQRDLELLRADHAVVRSEETTARFVGNINLRADQAAARLRRLARDTSQTGQVRWEAEFAAWRVEKDRFEILQKAGILPSAAQEIHADVRVSAQAPSPAELLAQYQVIEAAAEGADLPADLADALRGIGQEVRGLPAGSPTTAPEAAPGAPVSRDAAEEAQDGA